MTTTQPCHATAILHNNRGAMWIKEGFYSRAIDSLKQAFANLPPQSFIDLSLEQQLTNEQQRQLRDHLVTAVPSSRCRAVPTSHPQCGKDTQAPEAEILIYNHPITLSQPLDQHQQAHAPSIILEFNLALSLHMLGSQSMPLPLNASNCNARTLSSAESTSALDRALQIYVSVMNRYAVHRHQQQQQQQQKASQLWGGDMAVPIGREVEYFLALACLNNIGHIHHVLLNRKLEAMQWGTLLLQLHQEQRQWSDGTVALQSEMQQTPCMPAAATARPLQCSAGLEWASQPPTHRASTLPHAVALGSPDFGKAMMPYVDCFIANAKAIVGVATSIAPDQSRHLCTTEPTVGMRMSSTVAMEFPQGASSMAQCSPAQPPHRNGCAQTEDCWECLRSGLHCECATSQIGARDLHASMFERHVK